jgi:hypothetical protein
MSRRDLTVSPEWMRKLREDAATSAAHMLMGTLDEAEDYVRSAFERNDVVIGMYVDVDETAWFVPMKGAPLLMSMLDAPRGHVTCLFVVDLAAAIAFRDELGDGPQRDSFILH